MQRKILKKKKYGSIKWDKLLEDKQVQTKYDR